MSKKFPSSFRNIADTEIPRRSFLGGPAFQRGQVSVTVAPGGSGKSALTIAEAITLANGTYLFGYKKEVHARVWLINAEDDENELNRRLIAAVRNHFVVPEALEKNLYVDHLDRADIQIVRIGRGGPEINNIVYDKLSNAISENIDIVIIDPFIMTHSINENDNIGIDYVVRTWKKLAQETNSAIHLVHHSRKESGGEITADSSRGAASLHDAVRYLRTLNPLKGKVLGKGGYSADRNVIRIDERKSNYSYSVKPDYFEIIGHVLGNGDNVGVAVAAEEPHSASSATISNDDNGNNKANTYSLPTDEELKDIAFFTGTEICRVAITSRDWIGKYIRIYFNLNMRRDKEYIASLVERMASLNLIKAVTTPYSGQKSHIYMRPNAGFSGNRPGSKIVIQSREEMISYIESAKRSNGTAQAETAVAQSD